LARLVLRLLWQGGAGVVALLRLGAGGGVALRQTTLDNDSVRRSLVVGGIRMLLVLFLHVLDAFKLDLPLELLPVVLTSLAAFAALPKGALHLTRLKLQLLSHRVLVANRDEVELLLLMPDLHIIDLYFASLVFAGSPWRDVQALGVRLEVVVV